MQRGCASRSHGHGGRASKGIGAGIAKGLAAEGASVVVNYATSKEGADKVSPKKK
jgi:NAD(P)-dependent dehydrogenase (short-subunit alcohol dehydrogenase family)